MLNGKVSGMEERWLKTESSVLVGKNTEGTYAIPQGQGDI